MYLAVTRKIKNSKKILLIKNYLSSCMRRKIWARVKTTPTQTHLILLSMLSSLSLICERYLVSGLASLVSFPIPLDDSSGLMPPSRKVLKTSWALDRTSRISRREFISCSWMVFSKSAGLAFVASEPPVAAAIFDCELLKLLSRPATCNRKGKLVIFFLQFKLK